MPAQPTQQSEFEKLPFWRKIEIMEWWARFPALTLLVFLRRDLGYRMLNPLWLVGMTLFMIAIAGLASETRRPDDLLIFALAVLTLGLYQRYNRWQEFCRGVQGHSYYIGTSFLERFRWPDFLRRDRRIARYLDPLFCSLIGVLLLPYTPTLAWWIIFSAICLRATEHSVHRKELTRQLDTLDGMVDSEIQGEVVEHFSAPSGHEQAQASEGIPTGLGADIHERIKARKPGPPIP